jgi:hypothetical protein
MKLVYILGTSFSGSTLLSFLLDDIPNVVSVGEAEGNPSIFNLSESTMCSCGDTIGACPFWVSVYQKMSSYGIDFNPDNWNMQFSVPTSHMLKRLLFLPLHNWFLDSIRDSIVFKTKTYGDRFREIGQRNLRLMQTVTELRNASVFVDASKDPRRPVFLLRYCGIEAYIIHLVRDSLAYVTSARKHESADISQACRRWNLSMNHAHRLKSHWPQKRWLTVKYEELSLKPKVTLSQICSYIGLDNVEINPQLKKDDRHHILGNPMRLEANEQIKLDVTWRSALKENEILIIKEKTKKWRSVYNFDSFYDGILPNTN